MGIGDLNPVLWGCWLDFNSGVSGLAVCYCNVQPTGMLDRCDIWSIKVKESGFEDVN
jgi:hypothetical protein